MNKEKFLTVVDKEFSNEDFYELCKAFVDAALDSEKFKSEDGKVCARFSFDQMKHCSALVKQYLSKYETSVEVLKRAVRINMHNAVEDGDKRQKGFYDPNQNPLHTGAYFAGMLYTFTEMPENVFNKIFDDATL